MAGRRAVEVMAGYDLERDARFDRCLKPFRPGSFNRSASSEADRFVYRLMREKPPAAAPWRGLGALAFVESAKGSDPNDGETGETPP